MAGKWYRNSAKENIDAKLAIEGAGAGGRSLMHLAKIPLNIDDRKMKQQKLDNSTTNSKDRVSLANQASTDKRYLAELRSRTDLSLADKKSHWEVYKSSQSLEGKKVTASAANNATAQRGKSNTENINDNIADREHEQLFQANKHNDAVVLKKTNKSKDTPSKTVVKENDGVETTYKNLKIDAKLPLTDAERNKKTPKEVAKTLGWW